jgi:hypothetical protein
VGHGAQVFVRRGIGPPARRIMTMTARNWATLRRITAQV